jgi:hypothetical protein
MIADRLIELKAVCYEITSHFLVGFADKVVIFKERDRGYAN